ncbi:GNAT family N-acetyltransferase [Allostreptomyces psammosilenae]|uniref:Ribosomal protein S18 acetylase RimI-like enzyme n=1 Tax=Allostreptomyces psammosilenae TaxID=1892865 RepID=A0A852ZZF4_9ACTN|nr:GNAT family N-acetyltransferase [Allostreptomyces psammosilenae]NYI03971.1 ribosomal protein S18 acetylase RimI-like enzyme [Allostreptomyces psammosilenae]
MAENPFPTRAGRVPAPPGATPGAAEAPEPTKAPEPTRPTTEPLRLRPALPADLDFLRAMLREAFNWNPDRAPIPAERLAADPTFARYLDGWPGPAECGVVAEAAGEPVGATWLRLLPPDGAGYGFVAADVPELTLGVRPDWRGRGVGRALLEELAEQARAAGLRAISLSVERENRPAHGLYRSVGFRVVGGDEAADTMLREL